MEESGVIPVQYGNSPVWIEQINDNNATAEVTDLETEEQMEVPVELLLEDDTQDLN